MLTFLSTNIPVDLATEVIEKRWPEIEKVTNIPKKEFLYALGLCLNSTFFQYRDMYFQQISGLAMGGPVSAVVANLVMEFVEKDRLHTLGFKIGFYKRFVDDCLLCVPKDKTEIVLKHFNSFNKAIQFTMEVEQDKTINFLDLTLNHSRSSKIFTKWYQKPSHSGRYLNFFSDVPFHQKLNVVNNLAHRVITLTDRCYLHQCVNKAKEILEENGYPKGFVEKVFKKHLNKRKHSGAQLESGGKFRFDRNKMVKMPYVPGLSECLKKSLKETEIQPVFSNALSNRKLFTQLKSKTPSEKMSSVVYQIDCKNCSGSYIGETKRYLRDRVRSHKNDKQEKTALKDHMFKEKHEFDFENARVLAREKKKKARLVLEAIHIKRGEDVINYRSDTKGLSARYNCFFGSR